MYDVRISGLGLFRFTQTTPPTPTPPTPAVSLCIHANSSSSPVHSPITSSRWCVSAQSRHAGLLLIPFFLCLPPFLWSCQVTKAMQKILRVWVFCVITRFSPRLIGQRASRAIWGASVVGGERRPNGKLIAASRQIKSSKMCFASRGLSGMFTHRCVNQKHVVLY